MESISVSGNSCSLIFLTRHSLPSTTRHNQMLVPHRPTCLTLNPIRCSTSDNSGTSSNTTNDDANSLQAPTATPPTSAKEISFRRRSKRQARRQRENESMQSSKRVTETPPKKWEDMTLSEKAIELYVGEKGALFWLNKFAYASIFIMIGAWILFRFVGPALNLYQLDGPVLAPTDVFK